MTDPARQNWNATYKTRKMVAAVDFAHKAIACLQDKPGCSILDVGCGDGRDSLLFARQGLHVTAIDFSEEAIRRVRAENPSIEAKVMDILNMDFPDATFDAVYAHLSVHYFDDATTTAVFRTIRRMLKPDGLFFVKCKSTDDPLYGKGEMTEKDVYLSGHLRHFFSKEYMSEKLKDFEVLSLEKSSATYDGTHSEFVEAIAQKGSKLDIT